MARLSPTLICTLILLIGLQLGAISIVPRTQGGGNIPMTLAMLGLFGLGNLTIARLVHSGTNLGILVPFLAAVIPLCTVAIGILLYGESASMTRIGLLMVACVLVGFAARY